MSPLTQGLNYRSACDDDDSIHARLLLDRVTVIFCDNFRKCKLISIILPVLLVAFSWPLSVVEALY